MRPERGPQPNRPVAFVLALTLGTPLVVVAGNGLAPPRAAASCGQATCSLDPRLTAPAPLEAWHLRLDLAVEYIEQDQPWAGSHSVEVGEVYRAHHAEVSTTNITTRVGAELGITDRWTVGLMLPFVHREHFHLEIDPFGGDPFSTGTGSHGVNDDGTVTIGDATGAPTRWNFTALGDMQVAARYRLLQWGPAAADGIDLLAGLKLPTGGTGERNDNGEQAEMTLQPGTGSVDPLLGVSAMHTTDAPGLRGTPVALPLLASLRLRTEGSDGRYGYRPGTELICTLGAGYPVTPRLQLLAQMNFRYRDRDHVGDAPGVPEEDTGGEAFYLSPGVEVRPYEGFAFFSFVQVPVYQRVNGTQLVSEWNLMGGIRWDVNL